MRYKIFENGKEINVIVASEGFVTSYCASNGYSFEADPLPEQDEPPTGEQTITDAEMADAIREGVNGV